MAIAGYINKDATVADIGTDHGLLPAYLAQNGLARDIIATDVSAQSLESAHRTAEKYGVAHLITFIVAQGLEGIGRKAADTIVISGLGGETIAGILRDAPWTKKNEVSMVLQPQTKTAELCRWLRESGYNIRDARVALENDRYYVVILVKGGKSESILEPELEMLARLMFNRDPHFPGYLGDLISRTRKALDGMKNSAAPDVLNMALRLAIYSGLKDEYEKS